MSAAVTKIFAIPVLGFLKEVAGVCPASIKARKRPLSLMPTDMPKTLAVTRASASGTSSGWASRSTSAESKIGRASCRGRGENSVGAVALKKKKGEKGEEIVMGVKSLVLPTKAARRNRGLRVRNFFRMGKPIHFRREQPQIRKPCTGRPDRKLTIAHRIDHGRHRLAAPTACRQERFPSAIRGRNLPGLCHQTGQQILRLRQAPTQMNRLVLHARRQKSLDHQPCQFSPTDPDLALQGMKADQGGNFCQ